MAILKGNIRKWRRTLGKNTEIEERNYKNKDILQIFVHSCIYSQQLSIVPGI